MYLKPIPSSVTPSNTLRFLKALYNALCSLSYDPLQDLLGEPRQLQFEPFMMECFELELQMAFFQRLQYLEQFKGDRYILQQIITPGWQPDEHVFLFQYLLPDKTVLPECNLAFIPQMPDGLLSVVMQCLDYPGAHRITLTTEFEDTEGNLWMPGQEITYDRVDALNRWALIERMRMGRGPSD